MDNQHLIKMANQIGTFFESLPDEQEAIAGIANHLQKFWTPRMRAQLIDHIDCQQGAGLTKIVLASIQAQRAQTASKL